MNLFSLEKAWISLEVELFAGWLRMLAEGVMEKDIPFNFIFIKNNFNSLFITITIIAPWPTAPFRPSKLLYLNESRVQQKDNRRRLILRIGKIPNKQLQGPLKRPRHLLRTLFNSRQKQGAILAVPDLQTIIFRKAKDLYGTDQANRRETYVGYANLQVMLAYTARLNTSGTNSRPFSGSRRRESGPWDCSLKAWQRGMRKLWPL